MFHTSFKFLKNSSVVGVLSLFTASLLVALAINTNGATPASSADSDCPTISNLRYLSHGIDSTNGRLYWDSTNQDLMLYTGEKSIYPERYVYGTWTFLWPGTLGYMTPGKSYPVTVTLKSKSGCEVSASTIALNPSSTETASAPTPSPSASAPQVEETPVGSVKTGDGSYRIKLSGLQK